MSTSRVLQNLARPDVAAEEVYQEIEEYTTDIDRAIEDQTYAADQAVLRAEHEATVAMDRNNAQTARNIDRQVQAIDRELTKADHDLEIDALREDRRVQLASRQTICRSRLTPPMPPSSQCGPFSNDDTQLIRKYLEKLSQYNTDETLQGLLDDLRCPITREFMEWPVILLPERRTYDRKTLLKILETGDKLTPFTRVPFRVSDIVTNQHTIGMLQGILSKARKEASDRQYLKP